jgi:hypothetical protein
VGDAMAIKVTVNYPQTEEGMELLRNRVAEVIVRSLRRMLTKDQMNELVSEIEKKGLKN